MIEVQAQDDGARSEALRVPRRVAVRAIGWQSLATVIAQIIQTAVTLTAAALVEPRAFALWGIASVIFNGQNLVASLGLGPALVYRDAEGEEFRDVVDGSFLVTGAFAVAGGLALFFESSNIASLFTNGFSHHEVQSVIQVMSVVFAVTTVSNVPQAVIEKSLDFRRRALPDILGSVTYAVAATAMLGAGAGIWSLIVAKALQALALLALFTLAAPVRPRLMPVFDWRLVRQLLGYGKFFSLAALLGFFIANFDNVALGRWAGASALGAYTLAFAVANLVPTFLTATFGKVFFPLYTSVRHARTVLLRAYQGALYYVVALMLPVTVALATVAPAAFVSIFGHQWQPASPLIRILAVYGLARALGAAAVTFQAAAGRPGIMLSTQGVNLAVTLAALWPALQFGAAGIAAAFTAGQVCAAAFAVYASRTFLGRSFAARMQYPIIATAAAVTVALAAGLEMRGAAQTWSRLGLYAATYVIVLLCVDASTRARCRPIASAIIRAVPS